MRRAATPLDVAITGAASQAVIQGRGALVGWSLRETAAAATIVTIDDGTQATAQPNVAELALAASGSSTVPLVWPLVFQRGLFVSSTAGAIVGALWVLVVPDYLGDDFYADLLNLAPIIAL